MKAMKRFIGWGLRLMAAKPVYCFHQTLTFPEPVQDPKQAKTTFNRFMKAVDKHYGRNGLVAFYIQEQRANGEIHYHVCFLFFDPQNLPFSPSRMVRDFRTDIFGRWNELNEMKCVHPGCKLKDHSFDLDTLRYFVKATRVMMQPPARRKVVWHGIWNKKSLPEEPFQNPTKHEIQTAFTALFKKARGRSNQNDARRCNSAQTHSKLEVGGVEI